MSNKLPQHVAAVFATYPRPIRAHLLELRKLVLDTASATPGVGALEETLKWGEPAFLTTESGSGSTIRIAWKPKKPNQYALYFNCQTTLVDSFKTMFPTAFSYEGNRAIVIKDGAEIAWPALRICVEMALTYHLNKRVC